ncbi:hypothetical protein DMB37_25670 [Nocardia sp. CS682]|nr:hypothetical protein DMB37_25670 [Nocardia sp. CS682]
MRRTGLPHVIRARLDVGIQSRLTPRVRARGIGLRWLRRAGTGIGCATVRAGLGLLLFGGRAVVLVPAPTLALLVLTSAAGSLVDHVVRGKVLHRRFVADLCDITLG